MFLLAINVIASYPGRIGSNVVDVFVDGSLRYATRRGHQVAKVTYVG
jgi:hypothetical protein